MPQPLEWTNVILPNVAFCESWVGQYHHVPLSALWSTASQWPAHQQECGQLMYYMLHTAARLMYYMTGTDRRPSNHGREKPNAAAGSCCWVLSGQPLIKLEEVDVDLSGWQLYGQLMQ